MAMPLALLGDSKGGLAEIERALAISPNLASAHGALGALAPNAVPLALGPEAKKELREIVEEIFFWWLGTKRIRRLLVKSPVSARRDGLPARLCAHA
jgi:hypothetical protein